MIPSFIDKALIPHKPGVYLYKNSAGKVIYVGKAVDLYSRVSSYFSGPQYPRISAMVKDISSLETILVESEVEALILEANLIKKFLPLYNIRLTDDKDYLYIKVTKEDFPKVVTARKHDLANSLDYFGPFPSSTTVKNTLKMLRRVFPWCSNPPKRSVILGSGATPESNDSGQARVTSIRPCFYYHLGLCPGACAGLITKEEYRKIIRSFTKFMEGKSEELIKELTSQMTEAANSQNFEEASRIKKTLEGVNYLLQPNQTQLYLENPNFLEDQLQKSLESLQKTLNLGKLPERIELYDISNTQGAEATGSMVVLTNGEVDKSQYRKFKIKLTGKPNDVGMMQEMLRRRFKHPEWPQADLIIVDGGRAQSRMAKLIIDHLSLNIPIYGLAKRAEWLYHPDSEIIKLPKSSLAIRLLQKLRDEAHRFALSYHRKLRQKTMYNSRV